MAEITLILLLFFANGEARDASKRVPTIEQCMAEGSEFLKMPPSDVGATALGFACVSKEIVGDPA